MVLLDLWAVPRPSDIVLELVRINENQWTQKRNEHYQREVKESEQGVDLENAVDQAE